MNNLPTAPAPRRFRATALLVWAGLMPGWAWSDSTSSASSAASSAAGSASESLGSSSHSSSRATGVAQGPYTVVAVADVAGRPDLLQLQLQAHALPTDVAAAPNPAPALASLWLRLPRETVQREGLAAGLTLLALPRPYGVAFAKAHPAGPHPAAQPPFFLVLDDDWHRELSSRPLGG